MAQTLTELRRAEDRGLMCRLALRAGQFWDFVDKRDIDKHIVSLAVLSGTYAVTSWAMEYAARADRPGLDVAAIIAAVAGPYMALQAATIAWYFSARA